MWENTDQENSEYGHFSHSVSVCKILKICSFLIKVLTRTLLEQFFGARTFFTVVVFPPKDYFKNLHPKFHIGCKNLSYLSLYFTRRKGEDSK